LFAPFKVPKKHLVIDIKNELLESNAKKKKQQAFLNIVSAHFCADPTKF